MFPIKVRQQTERAGIAPALSAVFAHGRCVALEQVDSYRNRYIYQDDVCNKGNTSFYGFVNHVMLSLFLRPLDGRT